MQLENWKVQAQPEKKSGATRKRSWATREKVKDSCRKGQGQLEKRSGATTVYSVEERPSAARKLESSGTTREKVRGN